MDGNLLPLPSRAGRCHRIPRADGRTTDAGSAGTTDGRRASSITKRGARTGSTSDRAPEGASAQRSGPGYIPTPAGPREQFGSHACRGRKGDACSNRIAGPTAVDSHARATTGRGGGAARQRKRGGGRGATDRGDGWAQWERRRRKGGWRGCRWITGEGSRRARLRGLYNLGRQREGASRFRRRDGQRLWGLGIRRGDREGDSTRPWRGVRKRDRRWDGIGPRRSAGSHPSPDRAGQGVPGDGATATPAGHRGAPISHYSGWLGGGGRGRALFRASDPGRQLDANRPPGRPVSASRWMGPHSPLVPAGTVDSAATNGRASAEVARFEELRGAGPPSVLT